MEKISFCSFLNPAPFRRLNFGGVALLYLGNSIQRLILKAVIIFDCSFFIAGKK